MDWLLDLFGSMLLVFVGWCMLIGGIIANFICAIFAKKMILFWIFSTITAIGAVIVLTDGFIK